MKSNLIADDHVLGMKVLKARMAKFLLDRADTPDQTSYEMNARTAIVLQRNGLFREIVPLQTNDIDPATISNADHQRRVRISEGPLLFIQDKGSQQRQVIKVSGLLFSSQQNVRVAAIEYFISLGKQHKLLSAHSLRTLEGERERIASNDRTQWDGAALIAEGAIECDWMCNLAGVKQSAIARFEEGYSDFLPRVLRPPIQAIEKMELRIWEPTAEREKLANALAEIIQKNGTFLEALSEYFSDFGHLPLDGQLSASGLLRSWSTARSPATVNWDELWRWADVHDSPLARYHVCQILAEHSHLIADGRHADFWREVVQIVHSPLAEDAPYPQTEAWLLRCDVARHFCHYLEFLSPGMVGERLASLAWWLSERFSSIFGTHGDVVKQVRQSTISNEVEISAQIWRLVTPPTIGGDFRYGTLFVKSIWSLSLQAQLGPTLSHLKTEQIESQDRERIETAIKGSILAMFPPFVAKESTYAIDRTVIPTAEAWITICKKEVAELLAELISANSKLGRLGSQTELLNSFGKGNNADDVLLANMLRVLAYRGEGPVDLMWEKLADEQWRHRALIESSDQAVEYLIDALIQISITKGDKWITHLPHFLAVAAETAKVAERRKLLLVFTVLTCLASDTSSGIRRILNGTQRNQFGDSVHEWHQRLIAAIPWGSAWAVGRIRGMLAALHP